MTKQKTRRLAGRYAPIGGGAACLLMLAGLTGCETDSFMDPSVIGRWEMTPTVMPILDRLSSIEDEPADAIAADPIQPQDLIPEVDQYRFGPGDTIEVNIRDFVNPGVEEKFQPTVDSRGYIFIVNLKPIRAGGLTNLELVQLIRESVRDAGIRAAADAVVSVNVLSQRSQTFSIIGAVQTQQEYFIPKPNYRLLDALSSAGGFNETIDKIYVIRQVALSDQAAGVGGPMENVPRGDEPPPEQPRKAPELLDLLDKFSKPDDKPSPGEMGERRRQPQSSTPPPPIDLPDSKSTPTEPMAAPTIPATEWVYRDGQWVKTGRSSAPGGGAAAPGMTSPVVTQRIIEVPVSRLLAGDASVNVVIRPGDVLRVPPPKTGVVYLTGQVARPGPYSLGGDTKLTLLRSLDSAGGLGSLAIPERTDITRVLGNGRQATIRLNLRAIAEQTQPDIYLKPDDRINIGTNFWALPLAVVRGGFRASYGWGFILDRNFAGDVFGADPSLAR